MELSTIVFPLHILTLLFVVWNVYHADHMALAWVLGKKEKLDGKIVKKYHHGVSLGLGLMIVTGLALFYPMREFLLTRPQFFVKMACVLALVVNAFAIGQLQTRAVEYSFKELSFSQKLPLFISGGVSTLGWVGAGVMAFFLT